ncbi:MAG: UvrD-helicase domain-containing protein [Candidatus Rhabdochlamydia sp.]
MSSFDILSQDTLIPSRLFLEASAGTGKTFTIEHLFIRLLLEKKLTISQIVIVTFTQAATRELKERIRRNLEEIVSGKKTYPYLEGLTLSQKKILQEAAQQFSAAQIFTIHGFCAQLLRQFAFETNVPFTLTEWSEEEEVWDIKEFLRHQRVVSSGQLRKLLRSLAHDFDTLVHHIKKGGKELDHLPSSQQMLDQINAQLHTVPPFLVKEEFEKIQVHYKKMQGKHLLLQADQLEAALFEKTISLEVWEEWITLPGFFLENVHPSQVKVKGTPPSSHPLFELRDMIVPQLQKAQDKTTLLKQLQTGWKRYQQHRSEEKGKITPDDLLKKIHGALDNPQLLHAIRACYEAVVVDEFQDTDPLQWDIFKTIFLQDPSKHLYLIGDPKQSIYGFREADIYTFLKASKEFDTSEQAYLHKNFRTYSALIDQLNHLFCTNDWMDLPQLNTTLSIPASTAAQEGEGCLHFMIAEDTKTRSSKWPSLKLEETVLFPFIVQEIQQKYPHLEQVAILVKDRYQASRIRHFLNQWNIPAALGRKTPLQESKMFEVLDTLASCFLDPHQTASIKKMLLGPFAQLSSHELCDETLFKAKQILSKLEKVWVEHHFAAFFALFLNTSFGKHSARISCYQCEDHTLYEDLLEIVPHLVFSPSPSHFKTYLQQLKLTTTQDRMQAASQGVQIMTVHASKGLEFETVFALGLASRTPHQDLSEEGLQELDAEKMRQVYVALTRAKKQLYVPVIHEIPHTSSSPGEGSAMEIFLSKAKPSLTTFSHTLLKEASFHLTPSSEQMKIFAPHAPAARLPHQPLLSFSSLAHYERLFLEVASDGMESGIETGTVIHKILERYFNQEQQLEVIIRQEIQGSCLASHETKIVTILHQMMKLPLDDFTLEEICLDTVQTEMEFLYKTPNGCMKGFIDLCFIHNQKMYVIDWKSQLLPDNHLESVEAVMQAHDYHLQGQIYEEAIIRYLKQFPSLSFGGIYFIFVRTPLAYLHKSRSL